MTDPIADYLTRIRNALLAKHASVDIPFSALKVEVTKILEKEGYIDGYRVVRESRVARSRSPCATAPTGIA